MDSNNEKRLEGERDEKRKTKVKKVNTDCPEINGPPG